MSKLELIIKREFLAKVRNRTFLVMTILSPLLVVGMGMLVGYISKTNKEDTRKIAYVDDANILNAVDMNNTETVEYTNLTALGFDEARAKTVEGIYYGLLYLPKYTTVEELASKITFYSEGSPSIAVSSEIERFVQERINHLKIEEVGIDENLLKASKIDTELTYLSFSGEKSSKLIRGIRIAIGLTAGYLIMMFIIIYGTMVMRSVIEEKTSRIIEVIISSVRPFQLMMGKIIGTAFAGLLQFSIWGLLLLVIGLVASSYFGIETANISDTTMAFEGMEEVEVIAQSKAEIVITELLNFPIVSMFIAFIVYFLGGYLLYSAIYAAIGAAVDNETDTQQFVMPVLIPQILAVYVGFASVINEPHGTIATIFSMIPFTSPIVMLMRIPFGVPWWQIVISLVFLIATFIGIVWFASKIYHIGILMYGKKPSYKELLKWLKY